ncbi:MAG: hypothetical protein AVDCRST_MAG73-360 [uncultured Thermomicrobiales bacterium]|uniref:Uncharacterized protein n=1 Tax=uncultured Thermomicrobiales bacterium TaxID=1645740 RepID=A0A6J4TIF7_9BACT|nr:MAG: hypothetical protein AVDCRST_MAG73-360 [uncultured Thermomicrobiales bacterium]
MVAAIAAIWSFTNDHGEVQMEVLALAVVLVALTAIALNVGSLRRPDDHAGQRELARHGTIWVGAPPAD